jgi:threonine synthase
MAAAVDHRAVIFAPSNAPKAKVAQLQIYGANVILVDGTYDDAFDLSIQAAQEFGWYCRNTGYNPFTSEGKKTAAFEIWECWQGLSDRRKTPTIFVSVGDGNIISGLYKGFDDLHRLGWLERIPRLIGVQAIGSAAIANAFQNKSKEIAPVSAKTIADSISVNFPRDGFRALRAAKKTLGAYVKVSDDEIIDALLDLGKHGIFAEPAGAASFAGLKKAVEENLCQPEEPILIMNTGSGLKDIHTALQAAGQPPIIEPTLEAVKKLL